MTRLCFAGFNLMTPGSYFTILVENFKNHILAENTYFMNHIEWTEHKIMVLKPTNNCQIISQCHNFKNIHINDFQHHSFLYRVEVLWKSLFFWSWEWQIAKPGLFTIQIIIYYLIYSGTRDVFAKIMLDMLFNETSRYIRIYSPSPWPSLLPFFLHRINTLRVNIRLVLKKSWYSFHKVEDVKSWYCNNNYNLCK